MSSVRYEFQIPDPSRPIADRVLDPSGELVDFVPDELTEEVLVGRRVEEICTCVGTYGMGGPGFFGMRLAEEWLVFAIWGAASWIEVNNRIIQDTFWGKNNTPRPWMSDSGDELTDRIVGKTIRSFSIENHSVSLRVGDYLFEVAESPDGRPIHEGDQTPRKLEKKDNLRRAVFLAPTTEIWV